MNILPTAIPDVKLLQPQVHGDERGFFMETFRDNWFREHIAPRTFVQENHSKSGQGAAAPPLLANGPVPSSPPKTNTSSGCPKALPTASMY